MKHRLAFALAFLLVLGLVLPAQAAASDPEIRETTVDFAVKRQKQDDQPQTLRFLHANRNFLRSELDRLQTHRLVHETGARDLTAREKYLISHGEALRADQDSLRAAVVAAHRSDYLQSAADLLAFEEHLDELEGLLESQNQRLRSLEADFVGRQKTALALYVTGLPASDATAILVSDVAGDEWQIQLDAAQRAALRNGATAQLLHEFVEPRPTAYALALQHDDGSSEALGSIQLDPARDRLTFVEVDLSTAPQNGSPVVRSWER